MIYVVIMLVPWILLAAIDPVTTMTDVALILLLIAGALAVHVVAHEAAHALAALAVGMGVPEVELGGGPTLLRLRVGSTTVKVGGFHSGLTHLEPRSTGLLRTRLAVSFAAGPLSNLALAAAAYWLVDPTPGPAESFTRFFIGAGVVLGVVNLAPLKVSSAGGTVRTDGAALLLLLRVDRDAREQIVAASRLGTAHRQHLAGETLVAGPDERPVDRSDPVILGIEGTRRILTKDYDEAVALLREAASMPHQDDVRALTLNNLAWVLLLARPDGWLEEADRASADAISLKPWMEAMMGTRGCVLVHRGDLADARQLLQRAVQADAARHDRIILCRHLFRAEHGLGNLYGARAALLALVDNGAEPEEIESARALLRPWEADNALANLVGADGLIRWPDTPDGGVQARHVEEIRSALTTFVEDASDDPRGEAVRLALGGQGAASSGQKPE
jgi:tetratricopeptide (TPR) repeat protein